jgi:serine/threonine protein kinase
MQIEGELVSRQHAVISFQDGQYILYDRESTNGTWVNGYRIAQSVLQPGDQIQIGPSIFVFQMAGAPVPLVPARIPSLGPPKEVVYDFGDYERTETIGSGGAATVYKGICRRDGTTVAIKVLHAADPYLRDKFQKEGQIGETLRHPHIARIYGGGRSNGTFYIVMEYVDDRSLRERVTPGQPIPLEAATLIVGQTCDALQYAHSMGVYHRDIKPENIMFSSTEGVKLVDFGIARLASTVTRTAEGMIVGTPYYMSYEQARGWRNIDGRSDIYSLGVVLYEMVTGSVPFTGAPLSVVHQHIVEEPTPPRRLNPSLPSQIEEVVMTAMSKDRDRRFQTAEEMARALGYTEPMGTGVVYEPVVSVEARPEYVPGQVQLVVLKSGKTLSVAAGTTPLCRRDVDPNDLLISREHARIVWQGGPSMAPLSTASASLNGHF